MLTTLTDQNTVGSPTTPDGQLSAILISRLSDKSSKYLEFLKTEVHKIRMECGSRGMIEESAKNLFAYFLKAIPEEGIPVILREAEEHYRLRPDVPLQPNVLRSAINGHVSSWIDYSHSTIMSCLATISMPELMLRPDMDYKPAIRRAVEQNLTIGLSDLVARISERILGRNTARISSNSAINNVLTDRLSVVQSEAAPEICRAVKKLVAECAARGTLRSSIFVSAFGGAIETHIRKVADSMLAEIALHYTNRDLPDENMTEAIRKHMSIMIVQLADRSRGSLPPLGSYGDDIKEELERIKRRVATFAVTRLKTILADISAARGTVREEKTERLPAPLIPLPSGACWEDIGMKFIDGHTLRVTVEGGRPKSYNYSIMGFTDERTERASPNQQWKLLHEIADNGKIGWSSRPPAPPKKRKNDIDMAVVDLKKTYQPGLVEGRMKKSKKDLADTLKACFGLADDPFRFTKAVGWVPRFKIFPEG